MDTKNVLMAVILSTIIIVGWQIFVVDPELKKERETTSIQKSTSTENNTSTGKPTAPSLSVKTKAPVKVTTRADAIAEETRIVLENQKLKGSISLKGALIDDITFKVYKETLDKNSKLVTLLNPKQIKEGYFLESGWASADNLKVPDNNSLWKIKQNKVLTSKTPIELEWDNQN